MKAVGFLIAFLAAMPLLAAPPAVDIPAEVRPAGQYVTLSPKTEAVAITYIGLSGIEPLPAVMLKDPRMFLLDTRGLAEGRYKFVAVASLKDEHTRVDFDVVIGIAPPVVTPPGPGPVNPPGPSPGTPLTGMRVLILEETSPTTQPTKAQQEALHSPTVMAYLDQKAAVSSGERRWRRLDPDVTVANLPKVWQDMRAAVTNATTPQVVVAGLVGGVEKIVFTGPYPATPDEALAFFKKWGG